MSPARARHPRQHRCGTAAAPTLQAPVQSVHLSDRGSGHGRTRHGRERGVLDSAAIRSSPGLSLGFGGCFGFHLLFGFGLVLFFLFCFYQRLSIRSIRNLFKSALFEMLLHQSPLLSVEKSSHPLPPSQGFSSEKRFLSKCTSPNAI